MVIFQPVILVFRGVLSHKTSPLCRLPPLILITLLRLDSFTNINVCGENQVFIFQMFFVKPWFCSNGGSFVVNLLS